jgi:hypothetical protein
MMQQDDDALSDIFHYFSFFRFPSARCFSTLMTFSPNHLTKGFLTNVPSVSNHSAKLFLTATFETLVMSDCLYARITTL